MGYVYINIYTYMHRNVFACSSNTATRRTNITRDLQHDFFVARFLNVGQSLHSAGRGSGSAECKRMRCAERANQVVNNADIMQLFPRNSNLLLWEIHACLYISLRRFLRSLGSLSRSVTAASGKHKLAGLPVAIYIGQAKLLNGLRFSEIRANVLAPLSV
jgi:hypothetical protein